MERLEYSDVGIRTKLVKDGGYPLSISRFLLEEEKFLGTLCRGDIFMIVEVGCMNGKYFRWALQKDIDYLGLDISLSYIDSARKRIELSGANLSRYMAVCSRPNQIHDLLAYSRIPQDRIMVFFPFNCIGNINDFQSVVSSLSKTGANFFISTYRTDRYSTSERLRYYEGCSYKNIKKVESMLGVRFTSDEGLNTIAYHYDYLETIFRRYKIRIATRHMGDIGVGYYSLNK